MRVARCSRCRLPAPGGEDELVGDGGGDPALSVVLVPPARFLPDPDDNGIMHADCLTAEELGEWVAREALLDDDDPWP
jgi:hypothetical protein